MTRVNSTNFTGLERFVVDQDASRGNFTTIQAAIDAAALVGNCTIWINPGTYSENLVFGTGNFSIVGNQAYRAYQVTIDGNCTFTNHIGNFTIQNVNFSAAVGDNITVTSNAAASANIQLDDCTFNSQLGKCIVATLTAPATFSIDMNRCDMQGQTGNILLDGPVTSSVNYCQMNTNSGDVFDLDNGASMMPVYTNCNSALGGGVTIRGATCSFTCLYCVGSYALELVTFLAAGEAIVVYTGLACTAPSGFWATGAGTLIYTAVGNIFGKTVDPVTSQVTFPLQATGTAGTTVTAVRGSVGFDSTSFAVSADGFVTFVGSTSGLTHTAIVANQTLAVQNGYYVTAGALSLALPAVSALGDVIEATLAPTGTSFVITQGAGQQITLGSVSSTVGAGGSVATSATGDSLRIECVVANLSWQVVGGFTGTFVTV